MSQRYHVRRGQDDLNYSVWNRDTSHVALHEGRPCLGLSFNAAFEIADLLNAPSEAVPEGMPEPYQHDGVQQQSRRNKA